MGASIYKNKKPVLVFLIPAFLFMIVYLYYPFFQNIVNSFQQIKILGGKGTGFLDPWYSNYVEMFKDENVRISLINTLIMMLVTLVGQVGIAIILAVMVDNVRFGKQFFKTVYFFPIVISATALGLLFNLIFLYDKGMLNQFLENLGRTTLIDWKAEGIAMFTMMLPGMDGFEVCKRIREEKQIPILMVSAKKDDIDKIRGLGLGADDYMTKPFSPSELVARVKAHLSRYERLMATNQKANDVIEIRGIKIDKTARRVYINDEEKQFTTKEFDLLTFLAENPNHVFSKEELFREIWDMDSIGDIATVTVHIKKIREKIEIDTANPQYIETIWGVGYRFKV